MDDIDCNNCKYINVTESQQKDNKQQYICLKFNKRVIHNINSFSSCIDILNHNKIYPCKECMETNGFEKVKILDNPKQWLENLSEKEFEELLDDFEFEYVNLRKDK